LIEESLSSEKTGFLIKERLRELRRRGGRSIPDANQRVEPQNLHGKGRGKFPCPRATAFLLKGFLGRLLRRARKKKRPRECKDLKPPSPPFKEVKVPQNS